MTQPSRQPRIALGVVGGVVGGCVGYLAFYWIARQGFYAIIIPAGLLGLGAGFGAGSRSQTFAIACGIAGLAIGLLTEWQFAPFAVDDSFVFMLRHILDKQPFKLAMLAIGPVIAYRLALGIDPAPSQS